MALDIEDGTGLDTAEAYSSVSDADAYFLRRNLTVWATLTTEAKEAALIAGAAYVTERYEPGLAGERTRVTQGLAFPRLGMLVGGALYPPDTVPLQVKTAALELAYESTRPGGLWAVTDPNAPVVVERTVGPITRKFKAPDSTAPRQKEFDRVTALLARFVRTITYPLRTERV